MNLLAIETSCDETAAAVIAETGDAAKPWQLRSNVVASQAPIHREWGGVVPELASRQHLRDICGVVEKALADASVAWSDLGVVRMFQGKYAEAQRLLEQSLATLETHRGPNHPILLRTLNNLAAVLHRHPGHVVSRSGDLAQERQPVVEDVGVGVEGVRLRIDRLRPHRRRPDAALDVEPAGEPLRDAHRDARLRDVELVAVVDQLIEHAERMDDARVRAVHQLKLEADIDAGRLRVDIAADGADELVQDGTVREIREELAEVAAVVRRERVDDDATLALKAQLDAAGPFAEGRRCDVRLVGRGLRPRALRVISPVLC